MPLVLSLLGNLLTEVFDCHLVEQPILLFELGTEIPPPLLKLFDAIFIFRLRHCVLNFLQVLVEVEHAHEHLQVAVRDLIVLDVQLSNF